jgi:hypothetical protein
MSRIKNMSRGGWIVAGILVATLLVPSGVAVAVVLKYTGIKGANPTTATLTPAGVTGAGQLLTTNADPAYSYVNGTPAAQNKGVFQGAGLTEVAAPLPTMALIITSIHISAFNVTATGDPFVQFNIQSGPCTEATQPGPFDELDTNTSGETVLPYEPGVVVPAGDVVCGESYNGLSAAVTVVGYSVPGNSV